MALRKVKGALEHVLDKSLQDLVRGIRNHKESEGKYISECIEEIKLELKQDTIVVKANAINKLVYLQMLGYDISWAGFNIVEVMSSPKFTYKRIGYLAASQSFHDGTDVIMLTTNLVRKDLNSTNTYDAGVALSSLSCFMTGDLAHDLANDIMVLMTSTKPYLRKKAVLLMYKVFLRFPDSLKPAFGRLKEKLEDPDAGVQSAAVNVICELARKNPQNYLSLAPLFFKLMTTSTNNWVLIKIIKLFGALIPLEPRLGKKLIEPLTNLIHSTSAMSLLYECINTVIAVLISISSGLQNHATSVQLCVQKLQILIEDSDQNLKYLGLLAMTKILKTHPKSVQAHKELIMQCLDDKDESIRLRALSLLYGMVSKKNLMEIVKKLITHMEKAEGAHYRDELLGKIIGICSQNDYRFITNFEWYVSVLVELAANKGMKPSQGRAIANQLLDVAIRVQQVRRFAARQMSLLLRNHSQLLGGGGGGGSAAATGRQAGLLEVLYAAAWICGEFAHCLRDEAATGSEDSRRATLEAMSLPFVAQLPGEVQAVFVHNQLKLYASLLADEAEDEQDDDDDDEHEDSNGAVALTTELLGKLEQFVHSDDLEVQERAVCAHQLLKCAGKALAQSDRAAAAAAAAELAGLFAGELNPVAPKAQRKVPLPEGLDLDAWINEPPPAASQKRRLGGGGGGYPAADDSDEEPPSGVKDRKARRGKKASQRRDISPTGGASGGGGGFASYASSDMAAGAASATASSYRQPTESELAEMRESRLREQASNPNYLKPSSSASDLGGSGGGGGGGRSRKKIDPGADRQRSEYEVPGGRDAEEADNNDDDDDGQQLPPVARLDPGLPSLRLEGLTSSDDYLKQHRKMLREQQAKKKAAAAAAAAAQAAEDDGDGKKKRKKKRKQQQLEKKKRPQQQQQVEDEEEDEDDIPVVHAVSTTYDMPEGAAPDSDGEQAHGVGGAAAAGLLHRLAPDDPHRLLADIKLDDVMQPPQQQQQQQPQFLEPAKEAAATATTTKKKKKKAGGKQKKEDAAESEATKPRKKKKKSTEAPAADDADAGERKMPKMKKKKKQKQQKQPEETEDLLLLTLDDDPPAPPPPLPALTTPLPLRQPTLWLPIGESLTVRVDVSWRRAAAADTDNDNDYSRVDLTFRLVPLSSEEEDHADAAVIESASLQLEQQSSSPPIAFLTADFKTTAQLCGVSGDSLDKKLRASVTVRWNSTAAEPETLRVRVPRLCRLLPAPADADSVQAELAARGGAHVGQASARLAGLEFADCLARLRALGHPVDGGGGGAAIPATTALLHCRAAAGGGGGASLYLLLKRLTSSGGGSGGGCGLEAKSADAELAADSVADIKKLLGKASLED